MAQHNHSLTQRLKIISKGIKKDKKGKKKLTGFGALRILVQTPTTKKTSK